MALTGIGSGLAWHKVLGTSVLGAAAVLAADTGPLLNTVYNFSGYGSGSDYPGLGNFEVSQLLQASDGNLYGVSAYGGVDEDGYVFRVNIATGTITHLHDFAYVDGAIPRGALVQGSDGALYGTTESGGIHQSDYCYAGKFYNQAGCGTAFRIGLDGGFTKLHDFYTAADGYLASPNTGMVQAADGNFYGMASQGFPSVTTAMFKMTPAGVVTEHHVLPADDSQGYQAWGGLLAASDGYLYGTTGSGGAGGGCGTVFRAGTDGSFQVLHVFTGGSGPQADGCFPWARLLEGQDGNFYGTTAYGGFVTQNCIAGGCGTVFKLAPDGTETVLHRFTGTPADGEYPEGDGLAQTADGLLYGVTLGNPYGEGFGYVPLCTVGGSTSYSCGTLYRIDTAGNFTSMRVFADGDGSYGYFPHASPILAGDGNLYGSTISGGGYGPGTIYRYLLNPDTPILSIAGFSPAGGPPGTQVVLSGEGFTGTTQVTFGNGSAPEPIDFTVDSDTRITATIPADAQSSAFGVTAPRGTSFANTAFYLQPVIDSITPRFGRVGSGVTLNGAHFDALTTITFGGVPALRYSYVTGGDTSINVIVPQGARSGPIVVSNPGGSAKSKLFFVRH